ncbi:hypothetical protein AHAS_Ahas14G0097300 [Arachis hypogaea]
MSDPKGKGKAKTGTGKRKRGEPSMAILDILHYDSWREKNFTPQEKDDQLVPATDPVKFPNRYCELKYPVFATSRNLYLEKTLRIPTKHLSVPTQVSPFNQPPCQVKILLH